jgi:hypothetical protein
VFVGYGVILVSDNKYTLLDFSEATRNKSDALSGVLMWPPQVLSHMEGEIPRELEGYLHCRAFRCAAST